MDAIRSAVLPIAGQGTRMRPVSCAVPKALLPLVDAEDRAWCVLGWILADLASAGVERTAVVISPPQRDLVQAYLAGVRADAAMGGLLPGSIELIEQPRPAGFGEAVLLARAFAGDEPFLLALGDHVHVPTPGQPSAARQVVEAIEPDWQAVFGTQVVGADDLARVGTFAGDPLDDAGRRYRCTAFVEKPTPAVAADRLQTPGLATGQYLAVNGVYAFGPDLFEALAAAGADARTGEVELAGAMARMIAAGLPAGLVRPLASTYDTGHPAGYAAALAAVRVCRR